MEIGTVRQVDIDREMQVAYLDYAMSVIIARALPDVRDGLKPVHRRILYAMHDMGLHHDSSYKKSARIVGEVLGKYHPHGDAAVYDSMVRMAQDFSMRYLLVDGQGNFGSIDGDSAAAMRYTEARQTSLSEEMLADIKKATVDFGPNFDGSLQEPLVLPAAFPNLLVNGSAGIAVGMATNIPPHNLGEVCDALSYLIDNYDRVDEVSVDELMRFIQGPDFPTGGIIPINNGQSGEDGGAEEMEDPLRSAYAVGRGRITVQAKAHTESMSRNRNRIVVTELPYQVNKSRLIERIAELVRDGKLEGITDLRDESDRQGMRVIVEVTRNVDPEAMLKQLFRLTPMSSTFSIMLLALVDGEPRTLSLRRLLYHYVEHRREIITRRSQYDLERARERAHVLEGLLIALDNLDEVIRLIRHSRTVETAHANLRKRFKLTDVQAQAILDMPLRRLAALERQKIEEEYREKIELIAYLEDLLAHPAKILVLIKEDLARLKQKYGDERRTEIIRGSGAEIIMGVPVPDSDSVVVFERSGNVRREPDNRRYQFALGRGDEVPQHAVLANARDMLMCFTPDGRAFPIAAHAVPLAESGEKKTVRDLCNVGRDDELVCVIAISPEDAATAETAFLTTVTSLGKIKRTRMAELRKALGRGETAVMNVDENDRLLWAAVTSNDRELILVSADAQAIRFNEEEVRASGLGAGGVMAIKLADSDRLVGAGLVNDGLLLTVTRNGYGKISKLSTYPAQKRYGSGIVAAKLSAGTGPLAAAGVVEQDQQVILITEKGAGKRLKVTAFAEMGRATSGKRLVELPANETIRGAVFLAGNVRGSGGEPRGDDPGGKPGKPPRDGRSGTSAPKTARVAAARSRAKMTPGAMPSRGRMSASVAVQSAPLEAGKDVPRSGAAVEYELDVPDSKPTTRKTVARPAAADAKAVRVKKSEPQTRSAKPKATRPAPQAAKATETAPVAQAQPVEQTELDLPVKRRSVRSTSTGEKTPRKGTSKTIPAGKEEAELDLPVKRRAVRGQMPLPLDELELDLPAPVKKARDRVQPAADKTGERHKPAPQASGKAETTTDRRRSGAGGKQPRRITSTKPKRE